MATPSVSIVIPVYNDAATLAACVRGVLNTTGSYPDLEVIVVDDGSTDQGLDTLKDFPTVKVLKKARGGAASALNVGMRAAKGRDVVRLHADVVVDTADWLPKLIAAAYERPKAGIVGVRLVYPDGRIQSEGRSIVSGLGFHNQHRERKAYAPNGGPGSIQEVDSVCGALAYYRRDVIDAVGSVDENYAPAWFDDDDYCMGARYRGFKVYVHAGVQAIHYTRSRPPIFCAAVPGSEAELQQITSALKQTSERRHAPYWQSKWGWDPYRPDINEIRRVYGHTEICWQIGEPLRFKPASAQPTVDCCMVTWNTLPLLKRCLESLAKTDYPSDKLKVYVADNGSTDGSIEYLHDLATKYPFELNVITLPVNTGAPLGLNFTVVGGKGELVARLDDDIVLPPDWLKLMVADFIARPFAGCIGAKIINDDDRSAIQCGPYRHFPGIYGHDDEVDVGQADYVSRTTHVRGCCNLYRRDVFAKCGLFDLRFSPSQCDDPDHHLALLHAGYEIIYDGRVRVVHKLNNGLARSIPAMANQQGNYNKMMGKWGWDAFEILEVAIDLSREGRYLPDDGNTSAWLALATPIANFPRRAPAVSADHKGLQFRIYEHLVAAPEAKRRLEEYLSYARDRRRDGAPRLALDTVLATINFAPTEREAFVALADVYQFLGQHDAGRKIAKYGLHLYANDSALTALAAKAPAVGENTGIGGSAPVAQQMNNIGEAGVRAEQTLEVKSHLRVLMVNTFSPRVAGGDQSQLKKTRQYLQQLGVAVDICCAPRPDPRGYDLIHAWNTWFPHETLTQIKGIRAWTPNIPIVLSPIYWDIAEKTWADRAVPTLFNNATSAAQLEGNLALLASGKLAMDGVNRLEAKDPAWRAFEMYQKQLFGLVDHLLPQSYAEVANLKKTLGVEMSHTITYNAAEVAVFDKATPDSFIQQYGIKDFVISVGLVEPRKNQLMLLHALRDSGIPIVIVGRHYDRGYYQLCKKFAPKGTLFIEHMPHEQLASALKAARVFTLPSWMECASLANIEAALCGCALAVSDRTSEKEYFGENAYYCDPASINSIRTGVLNAYKNFDSDAPKRAALRTRFTTQFTWENTARSTLSGYEKALAMRKRLAA